MGTTVPYRAVLHHCALMPSIPSIASDDLRPHFTNAHPFLFAAMPRLKGDDFLNHERLLNDMYQVERRQYH